METVNYQCPSCGGKLHFSHETNKVECDYCGSSFTVEEVEQFYAAKQEKAETKAEAQKEKTAQAENNTANVDSVVEEGKRQATKVAEEGLDPVAAYVQRSNWAKTEEGAICAYTCSSCGAELIVDIATAVTQCPYCGNNTVLPGTLGNTLKPDLVIPFKKGKEDAIAALKQYYKGKKFLPKSFADENHFEDIQGVYVPFWLYDATTDAQASFECTKVRSWREGKYQITETDFYDATRAGTMSFTRVPVDGSQRMPDTHMDAIEPYDYSELQEFSTAFLPGYLTDRYDLDVKDCQPRAYNRMAASSVSALQGTVLGYSTVSNKSKNVSAKWENVSYALLPVWMLHTKWNDEDYLFAMNGQTGKLIGDLPVDGKKLAAWFLGLFVGVAAIATIPLMAIL